MIVGCSCMVFLWVFSYDFSFIYDRAKMIVLDDLMHECSSSNMVSEAFTRKRHHHNLSVIIVLQNLYSKGSAMRDIHLNAQYIVLFQNPRDKGQFNHFARQVEPTLSKSLIKVYIEATNKPYSHLMVDLKPHTPNMLRYRSNTLSDTQTVFIIS
jgi:hypothetical protein